MHIDYKRLGKQRVETRQIQKAIQSVRQGSACWSDMTDDQWKTTVRSLKNEGHTIGWALHPATIMWRNNIVALMWYGDCIIHEWILRGYNNGMSPMCTAEFGAVIPGKLEIAMPDWLGDEDLHASHRSNLLRKDLTHYGRFNWTESDDIEYVWPT